MNLEVTKGEVAARITVENYKTKEILEANIQNLQEELEETGMEIKSFEVFVGQDSDCERDGNERFNFFNQKNNFGSCCLYNIGFALCVGSRPRAEMRARV